MQIFPDTNVAQVFDRLVEDQVPGRRGLEAWRSLLRAHATLMRRPDTDRERETGLALADFDVLAQLAEAHGQLRMTELADRALISRSGMSRHTAGRRRPGPPRQSGCRRPRGGGDAHRGRHRP